MRPQRDQHDQADHDGAAPDLGAALPRVPAAAEVVFGDRLPLAQVFVEALATTGVAHGLIGPREIPRLWERHVLNCAVVAELVPRGAAIVDVGSGAGLPGLALAIACPASEVHLVEPRRRATDWLTATASAVGLDNVVVHQGRAQDVVGTVVAPVATARAVTRIGQLAQWCAPLTSAGGTLLALKGATVVTELEEDSAALRAAHVVDHEVLSCGAEILETPTTVARLYLADDHAPGIAIVPEGSGPRRGRAGKGRRRASSS
ncbi:16S rRNA (guanine(527)-N(7))-methyltransferase RsmG [Arsenicicoccus bolidensis]|uniref:Ribosomal RNA small subunit methyltransferase G n=1 Tax=Arsenicicoccus bolidensis TaxID=229480 RepID=A0ABS9Q0A5_9MICO|nr:16S rRNA (guanine(527)-N(7))-methyltransferase RsmG [Arsenicicoccus bolidensis]MCG7320787.1 16S rRNA (guanine(527)-N(7))-methyltransferase RsmG [Arsenicicoccus bolidensis]